MYKKGVTLVELAIVLVVIGLLVSGSIAGARMLAASKVNAVITNLQNYNAAYNKFKDIYSAFPGDMLDPTSTFGRDCVGCSPSGDGNTLIENIAYSQVQNNNTITNENLLAWQELGLAGLIDGKYNGLSTSSERIANDTIPPGPFTGAGYDMVFFPATETPNNAEYPYQYYNNNSILYGVPLNQSSASTENNSALTVEDAFAIDTKMDDGQPLTGIIVGLAGEDGSDHCLIATQNIYQSANNGQERACNIALFLEKNNPLIPAPPPGGGCGNHC